MFNLTNGETVTLELDAPAFATLTSVMQLAAANVADPLLLMGIEHLRTKCADALIEKLGVAETLDKLAEMLDELPEDAPDEVRAAIEETAEKLRARDGGITEEGIEAVDLDDLASKLTSPEEAGS